MTGTGEAHEFMSRQLRQTGDINDNTGITAGQGAYGTVNGKVARLLSTYVGDTLLLQPGVLLRNFDANSTNNINHQPITVDSGGLDTEGSLQDRDGLATIGFLEHGRVSSRDRR